MYLLNLSDPSPCADKKKRRNVAFSLYGHAPAPELLQQGHEEVIPNPSIKDIPNPSMKTKTEEEEEEDIPNPSIKTNSEEDEEDIPNPSIKDIPNLQ